MSSPPLPWDRLATLALGFFGAAFAAWKLRQGQAITWEGTALAVAGTGFLVMALMLSGLAVWRLPVSGRLLERYKSWRRERMRQRENNKWQTARDLEIVVRACEGDRVAFEPIHSLDSSIPWPAGMVLHTQLSEIEVISRYTRPVVVDRIWIGIFDPATGEDIRPSDTRRDDRVGELLIEAQGRQIFSLQLTVFFAGLIRRGENEIFLVVRLVERGCQRLKIRSLS